MCKYYWNEAKLFKFLRLYKGHECLWNPYSSEYGNYIAKSEAFSEILYEMNTIGLTINECLSEIKYLREKYKQEQQKLENLELLGGRGYSNLLWYPLMNGMLLKVVKDEEKMSQKTTENLELVQCLLPKYSKSFINDSGDRLTRTDNWRSSCPTCNYFINVRKNRSDPRSQIVSYNQPERFDNYKNRIFEINSTAIRIPVSQRFQSPGYNNFLMKSCTRISKNRETVTKSLFEDIENDMRVGDDRYNIDDNNNNETEKIVKKNCCKKICWREPVEESFHIISPCKSMRSASTNETNFKGRILTRRKKSSRIRLIADSDFGIGIEKRIDD